MNIPPWLAALTGAGQFANNPANNFAPTFGDGLQGIGHSMMQHYRGQGGQPAQPAGAPLGQTGTIGDLLAGLGGAPTAPIQADAGDQMFLDRYRQQGYEGQPRAFQPQSFAPTVFSRFIGPQP